MTADETVLEKFKLRFKTEYICLSCNAVFQEKYLRCPKCQAKGLLCPRVVKTSDITTYMEP